MAKIIRLTAKNGTIKEVPLGAKIKIDAQFVGAKVEIVEKANGAHIAAVKSHVEGEDLVLSYLDDGQEKQVRVEGAASSSEASSAPAASEAPAGEQAAAAAAPATDKDDDQSGGGMGGAGLALLGLGALGGIAAAAGGGGGGDKGGSTPPADTTAPTATITLSDTNLTVGETAVVTITFSEAVVDFSNADLDVQGGQLSTVSSSDGGKTWTGTFTPTSGLSDTTNVITLGTAYRDAAGNAGQAATSPNYVIDTLTFTVTQSGNAISFGGTATGPITITLNAQNQAVFSRSGATSTSTIDSISTKILDVPQGGTLNLVLEPGATADTFTINAPNAATINVTGNGGALNDTLAIIIESATSNPDLRTMTLNTSGLTGVEAIKFIFPQDARDVVKLTANSVLTGFSTIEVSKGGVDLTAVTVVPGTEFIVNSTLIVTLEQFKAMSSLVSVTGMGKLTINLTDSEVSTGALAAFLNDTSAQKPILIGAEVTIKNAAGQTIAAPAGLDAISFPGIPGLQAEIEALVANLSTLTSGAPEALDTLKEIATKLASLDSSVSALQSLTGDGGAVDTRLAAIESAISDVTDTLAAKITTDIGALETKLSGTLVAGDLATLKALSDAVKALQAANANGGSVDTRIDAIEAKLAGITDTVVAKITADVGALETKLSGTLVAGDLSTLKALSDAVKTLQAANANGGTVDLRFDAIEAKLDGITSTVVAKINAEITTLESKLSGSLETGDLATLKALSDAVKALQAANANGGTVDLRFDAIEAKLDGITSTVVAKITAEVSGLETKLSGALGEGDLATLKALSDAVKTLQSITGDGGAVDSRLDVIEAALAELLAKPLDWNDYSGTNALNEFTVAQIFGTSSTAGGVTVLNSFISAFAARIDGYDPATVPLHVTGDVTVAQAVALAQAGLPVNTANVSYSIRDAYTTVQSSLTNPQANAAMAGATEVVAYGNSNPNTIDMMAFGPAINLRIESGAGNDTMSTGAGDQTVYAARGADTIWLTPSEDDVSDDKVVYQNIFEGETLPITALTFSDSESSYREGSVLRVSVNGVKYTYTTVADDTPATALERFATAIDASAAVGGVIVKDNVLEIYGATPTTRLTVLTDSGSPDTIVDISNPGQKTVWSVDFSSVTYPDNRSLLGTFEFDRKVYITIGNTQVSADIVYSTPGTVDKEATILALKGAIEAKMASGQPLANTIGAVTLRANRSGDDDLVLVLEGKTVPLTDSGAPSFTVSSAAVDAAGEQQQTSVAFSTDNADYYAGGTLSVTVAGTTVTAAMVDGDASASVSNLVNAISRKVNGERTGSFSFNYDIEADSVFNSTNLGVASYAVSLTIGGTEYVETAYVNTSGRATTVSGLVDKLNTAFSGVATFSVDGANDKILMTALGDYPVSGGIVLYLESGGGELFAPVVQTSRVQATLTGIEGVAKVGDTGLTLTASTEAVDPLNVAARQDFEGEYQQATILLEDASFYDYRTDGTEVPADREAKVLFAGGKINVTIAPVVDGTAGTPVTVSADMREDDAAPLTWELAIGPEFGGTATIEVLYTNADNQRVATLYTNYNGANGNYSQFLAYVAQQSPYIKTLTITESGVLTATYENGAAGTSPSVRGYYNNGGHNYVGEQIFQVVAGEVLTLQGVAAAIEAAPGLAGLVADATVVNGTIVLTAANPGKETFQINDVRMDYAGVKQLASFSLETAISYSDYSSDLLLGEVQPTRTADVYFNGGKAYVTITPTDGDPVVVSADMQPGRGTIAYVRGTADFTADSVEVQSPNPVVRFSEGSNFVFLDGETVGQFLTRLSEDPRIVSARIETTGPESGNIVIESVVGIDIIGVQWGAFSDGQDPYPDTVSTTIVAAESGASATAQALVEAINANKALETVIESASYDAVTGQITLTALNSGAETFAISDVRLDYSGVTQLASVSLDTATAYEAYSFTDAGENTVLIRDGAEPSIYFEGGKAWLEIAQIGTEGQPVGFFAVSANMGATAQATAQALVDAINLEAGANGDLSGLIAGATLSGSTITLQAAQSGDLTFKVGKISLDYQGVQQIAQADFSATENIDYYAGGKLRVVIDKTPTVAEDTENDVLVEADMVAGSEADSISALVTAIENSMGIVAPASAAVVEVGSAISRGDPIYDGSGLSSFRMEFFYDADGSGSGAADFYKLDLLVDENPELILTKNATIIGAKDYFNPMNLGDVIDYLNGVAGVPVTFSVSAGGTLVMTADQAGTTEIGLKIVTDSYGQVGTAVNTADGTNGYFTDTGTAAQLGSLNGIISSVTQSNGVITLTSANKQQEQFSIGKAEIDYAGEKQVVTVTFDDANASYYDLANYGSDGSGSFVGTRSEIGVTLHGRTFTQAMFTTGIEGATAAERTVAALEAQIEAARLETDGATPTAFATWLNANIGTIEIVDDGSDHLTALRFTAKNPNSADLIDLSESFTTVAPTIQQTRLDFAGINFDGDGRLTQTGQSAKVQVSIAGTVITANQTATEAGSLRNLVEQIVVARDGAGVKVNGQFLDDQSLILTSSLDARLAYDPFTVSLTVGGQPVSFQVDPLLLSVDQGAGMATVADLGRAIAAGINSAIGVAGYSATYNAGSISATFDSATVEINVVGGLPFKTLNLTNAIPDVNVSAVLDKVTFDGASNIVLTAKNAGVDPLNVSTQYQMEDKASIDGKPHIINLTFDNSTFDTAEETPIGTVIAVKIDGITAQVTIDETLSSAANRSEAIVAKLKDAIIAADDAAGTGSMIGTVKQGSLNGSTLIEAGETLADGQNVLQITADRNGAHLLGRAVDGTLSIRVTAPGDVTVPLAATAGVAQIGNIVYTYQSGSDLLSDVMQGRDEGVLTFVTGEGNAVYTVGTSTIVDETYLVPDLSTSGSDGKTNTPESQSITNAGFNSGDNSSFFGDQAKTGALVAGAFNGQGVLQSFVNPDGSYTATSGSSIANAAGVSAGNVTFYGDDAALGSDAGIRQAFTNPDDDYSHAAGSTRTGVYDEKGGNDVYFGDNALSAPGGVKQTYTNPSSGYTAINNSPQLDANDPGTGNLDLTGSDPGYYADNGLYTTWLNGSTPRQENVDGAKDLYAPDVITVDKTVNAGAAETTSNLSSNDIDNDKIGFAAFTWDDALQALVTQGNAGPDVIHNFQGGANGDVILLEGGLAASTLEGTLDRQTVGTPSVTYQNATAPSLTVDNLGTSRSSDTVFDFTTAGDGAFLIGRTTGHSPTTLFFYNPGTGWQGYTYTPGTAYNSPLDMVNSIIDAAGFAQDPIVSYVNGILTISAVGSGYFATDYQGNLSITRQVVDLPDFNLSTTEFGLVDYLDNADSSHAVTVADLDDATAVSGLLNSLFEFVATANGHDNSTIFAVTASDDSSVTAIWAHKQSSDTDSTVDPLELTLLAMVNTVDAEFAMSNFDIHQAAPPL